MFRDDFRSTIWMMGSDFLDDGTATVFFVRASVPLRATGRAVVPFRIQTPLGPNATLRIG